MTLKDCFHFLLIFTVTFLASLTLAQTDAVIPAEKPWRAVEADPITGGDIRAPSPKIFDRTRQGYFQLGAGPAFGTGFSKDDLMYNLRGSYSFNMDDAWTLKALADLYLGAGRTTSRMMSAGVGADLFLQDMTFLNFATPYLAADASFASARNERNDVSTGLSLGAGTGFSFQARQLNWDIGLHYAVLTQDLDGSNPQITTLRAAVNF